MIRGGLAAATWHANSHVLSEEGVLQIVRKPGSHWPIRDLLVWSGRAPLVPRLLANVAFGKAGSAGCVRNAHCGTDVDDSLVQVDGRVSKPLLLLRRAVVQVERLQAQEVLHCIP